MLAARNGLDHAARRQQNAKDAVPGRERAADFNEAGRTSFFWSRTNH